MAFIIQEGWWGIPRLEIKCDDVVTRNLLNGAVEAATLATLTNLQSFLSYPHISHPADFFTEENISVVFARYLEVGVSGAFAGVGAALMGTDRRWLVAIIANVVLADNLLNERTPMDGLFLAVTQAGSAIRNASEGLRSLGNRVVNLVR